LELEDVDVARERARVKKADAFMDELLLKRLTKVNKTKIFIHSILMQFYFFQRFTMDSYLLPTGYLLALKEGNVLAEPTE
jgi:hypothetical protein